MTSHEENVSMVDSEISSSSSPFASHSLQKTAIPPVAGAKELRVQQQDDDDDDDDDDSEDEEEEGAVAQAVVAEDDDEEDDDGDAVMAAVVVDEEDDEDIPLAELAAPAKKQKTHSTSKSKKKHRKSSTRISQDRLVAATDARNMLVDTVPRLPVLVSDTHVVRSFGRIQLESSSGQESQFSTANALYPVGFSCDRYEFSPVHGRVLKMRCTIFDAKKLKEKQDTATITDGPIFRVMWGQGVDEDVDIVDYPYDVFTASASITNDGKVDTVAVPLSGKESTTLDLEPQEGMRVKVRFEHNVWFSGTVVSVGDEEYDSQKKQTVYDIRIHYDDGSIEDTRFPDADISIYLPGE